MRKLSLLLGLVLVGVPATAVAQDMEGHEMAHEKHDAMVEEAREAITERSAELAEAFSSGDAGAVAAFYTDDALVMAPGMETMEGQAAIETGMADMLAQMDGMNISFEVVEVTPAHRGAIEVGDYTVESTDGSHVDHGKYMVLWEKSDDGWKVARDIWNSSMGGGQ